MGKGGGRGIGGGGGGFSFGGMSSGELGSLLTKGFQTAGDGASAPQDGWAQRGFGEGGLSGILAGLTGEKGHLEDALSGGVDRSPRMPSQGLSAPRGESPARGLMPTVATAERASVEAGGEDRGPLGPLSGSLSGYASRGWDRLQEYYDDRSAELADVEAGDVLSWVGTGLSGGAGAPEPYPTVAPPTPGFSSPYDVDAFRRSNALEGSASAANLGRGVKEFIMSLFGYGAGGIGGISGGAQMGGAGAGRPPRFGV